MAEIREVTGSWVCTAEVDGISLAKGLRLTVDAAVAGKPRDVECEVVGWQYRLRAGEGAVAGATLEITVQEVTPPGVLELTINRVHGWYAALPEETRFFGPMVLGILTIAAAAMFGWTIHVNSGYGLALLGRHARAAGDCLLAAFFTWMLVRWRGGAFFFVLQMFAALVVWGCWQSFTALPPNFGGSDADYAAYIRTLGAAMSKSYWPLVVAALPWLSVATRLLGMEQAGKIAESLERAAKKKKE